MNIRKFLPSSISFVGLATLALTVPTFADEFTITDNDFIDGVYEFRYYSNGQKTLVNGTTITPASLFITNDGWQGPGSLGNFWYANGGFTAQLAGTLTMGWKLSEVTHPIAKVEIQVDALFSQFDPWTDEAWGDRQYGEIATPDAIFGTESYTSFFEFIGDNNSSTNTFGNDGQLIDITDLISSNWLADPTLFELKLGYEQHPIDAAHPSIPAHHIQVFRDGTGTGDDSFLLRITLAGSDSNLVNISTRGQVGIGPQKMIAGFVIQGAAPKTVLIRGVGPTLGDYGVTGVLEDPFVDLVRKTSTDDVPVSDNDDWNGDTAIASAMAAVGAFPLDSGSKDACLLVTLDPGAYTAKVSGVDGMTGIALAEVYEVP
jgi:hypothetical protein